MSLLRRFLKSQAGMTIAEMVVAGGIAGMAAMGAASLLGGMGGSNRDAELIIEKTQFASSLGVYLNSNFGCTELKSATISGANFSTTEQDIKLDKWKYRGVPLWKNATPFSEKFEKVLLLKTITGKLETVGTPATVTMSYLDSSGVEVTEQLTKSILKVRAVIEMNSRDYPHEFNIPVLLSPANDIRFCGDSRTMAETCGSLGGKFNTATGECKLKETCQVQGTFIELTCAPEVAPSTGGLSPYCDKSRGDDVVNPVTTRLECPAPSKPIATGGENWTISKNCGKKCTVDVNNSLGYYTCMYCP